jgi:hypothetical protein
MITHRKRVLAEDGTDPNSVHPSDWNDEHAIDGLLGLFADLTPAPNAFPVVAADGSGTLAPVSAPALSLLSRATVSAMLELLGGVSPASPSFTGSPMAPTAPVGTNTDQIATMAALQAMRADLVGSAPATLDTLKEIADALGSDPNLAATLTAALGLRLRVDATQNLTAAQQAQAIANLALAVVASSGSYTDLKNLPTLGTASKLNVGTGAGSVVQLDSAGKLPALDGSQLIGVSGSVSYAAAQALSDAQRLQAIANLGIPHECGRLLYSTGTALTFKPYKGDLIKIAGAVYRIPTAGMAGLANTGVFVNGVAAQNLAASTLYYVYAWIVAGVVTTDFSTVPHATSTTAGNIGTEIANGNDSRSLIGMIYTNTSAQFSDPFTATWFNRRTRSLAGQLGDAGSPGGYFQEVGGGSSPASPGLRCYFLTWADENTVEFSTMANVSSDSTMNIGCQMGYGALGAGPTSVGPSTVQYVNTGNNQCVSAVASMSFGEGVNYATIMGGNNAGIASYLTQVFATGIRG